MIVLEHRGRVAALGVPRVGQPHIGNDSNDALAALPGDDESHDPDLPPK